MPPSTSARARLLAAVVVCEVRQALRDPNTLIFSVAFPLLFLPFVLWTTLQARAAVAQWEGSVISLVDGPIAPLIEGRSELRMKGPGEAPDAAAHAASFATPVGDGVHPATTTQDSWIVEYRSTDPRSVLASERLRGALSGEVAMRLHDVAPASEAHAGLFARALPMLVLFFSSLCAIYPAIEAVVADRERQTEDTHLVAAAPRWVFALGKLASVATVVAVAVCGAMASTIGTLYHFALTLGLDVGVSAIHLVQTVPFAVCAALMSSGLCLAAASGARNFKQAQNLVSTASVGPMLLAVVAVLAPRLHLDAKTGFVPVLNLVLVMRETVIGGWPLVWAAVSAVEALLLAVASAMWARRGLVAP
jgi:ABC-type Na+ efflux pump permease subunit